MSQLDLLPGTLDMLVLKTIARGEMHGYGIAQYIRRASGELLEIGEGSLYPALQRLLVNGWVSAAWRMSETNRRARYYKLTADGRKRLAAEKQEFGLMLAAIQRVMDAL